MSREDEEEMDRQRRREEKMRNRMAAQGGYIEGAEDVRKQN